LGSGLFAGAGYFAFSATLILWFIFAAGFAWLYEATTGLSTWGCGFFGVLTAFVLVLIIAVILALLGRNSFRKVHGPSKTPVTIEQAIDSIESGIRQGSAAVKRRYGRRAKDRADETAING
jgi:membrane protein implicated in regulation of membrane protease activity